MPNESHMSDTHHEKRENLSLFKKLNDLERKETEQLVLLHSDNFAFDEMNLVEIPFCLLQKQSTQKKTVPLSPTGDEYLEATKKYGLPTSLAEPTVLGLMWLTMDRNKFQSPKVTFTLRELVEDYMYPGQFTRYRAGGRLLKAVEQELHRIAATRLHSSRWYNHDICRHEDIDAAIIDSVAKRKEGGNSPIIVEIVWGNKIYDSVRARYTKGLDVRTWLQIDHALDRRLYRWLDRQLYEGKTVQVVVSCQKWAKHKMLMQGTKIGKGGRTASSYIFTKVSESLERLNGVGFAVRMTSDKSKPDFSLCFEKIKGSVNEVVDQDFVAELVHDFLYHFQKRPKSARKRRLRESDRRFAARWIEDYGFDKALWMVKRCKEIHDTGWRSGQRILYFVGLEAYEEAACADFERNKHEEAGQLRLHLLELRRNKYSNYLEVMLKKAESILKPDELEKMQIEAEQQTKSDKRNSFAIKNNFESAIVALIDSKLQDMKLKHVNAMSAEEFNGYETEDLLHSALIKRHGWNPLQN